MKNTERSHDKTMADAPNTVGDTASHFVNKHGPILALDIGSGTQDVLLALPNTEPENWPKFILPAPARQVAARVQELTTARAPIWLCGMNMGGGFAPAVIAHLKAGLPVAASSQAATALHDKAEFVRSMGVIIADTCPPNYAPVFLADFDPGFWNAFLSAAHLPLPQLITAAVQDHGVHADMGNREGRFRLWRNWLLSSHGDPLSLLAPPLPACTRLHALQTAIGGGMVADTGTAAVLGALSMPEVADRSQREGIVVVNVGNSHTIAFLVWREQIFGIYEHHTGLHTTESLVEDLRQFRLGWLPDEQVRAAGGHGCVFSPSLTDAAAGEAFRPTYIIGPRRAMLTGYGQFIAPHGDMMLTGCYGLLHGLAFRHSAR